MDFKSEGEKETILIDEIRQGNRDSFNNLVSIYQHKGLAIAYNLVGNAEDAKDVLQEAFIKVYFNINNFQGRSKFSTWLYRIIVNTAWDLLRKRKKAGNVFKNEFSDKEIDREAVNSSEIFSQSTKIIFKKELKEILDKCIDKLPLKQRLCFILKHENCLNIKEIAEIVKCSPSTVKVHLFRAIRNLEKNLSPYLTEYI